MAAGDFYWFDQALVDLGKKLHDLSADTINYGIVTGVTPAVSDADPRWGASGSTNYSSSQVATGGTSYTGPAALASVTWTLSSGKAKLDAADISLAQDASGFTNGTYLILYNATDSGKRALGFLDLGTSRSLVTGPLNIVWAAAGIATIDQG